MLTPLLLVVLSADPSGALPPKPPEAARAEPAQVKLAASDFAVLNLPRETGTFYANHFAQQLDFAGVRVVTPQEVAAVIGFERQRQLLGCAQGSESCMAELGDALGVDALITGDLGKIGDTFQLNVKVVSQGAGLLALHSAQVSSEKELLQSLTEAAYAIAPELGEKLGKPVTPRVAKKEKRRNVVTLSPLGPLIGLYTLEYERVLRADTTLYAEFIVQNTRVVGFTNQMIGFAVGGRRFFGANAPAGFFASGEITFNNLFRRAAGMDGTAESTTELSGGVVFGIGYTWLFWDWLDLSVGFGAGIAYGSGVNLLDNKAFSGFGPIAEPRLSMGVAF